MQSATQSEMDYSGASNQTYLFDYDANVLEYNMSLTMDFIGSLGEYWRDEDRYGLRKTALVWRNVPFNNVRAYIEQFKFNERLKVFNDTKPLLSWLNKMTTEGKFGPWNIIIAGKGDSDNGAWTLPNGRIINKVNRTRKIPKNEFEESIINIGALRDPRDVLSDIDVEAINDSTVKKEIIEYIESGESKQALAYRDKSGLATTPQMIIYCVDKNSHVSRKNAGMRIDLNAPRDIIGICLYIPGGKIGVNYTSKISIKMQNDLFDGTADMEGTDEN